MLRGFYEPGFYEKIEIQGNLLSLILFLGDLFVELVIIF